MTLQLTVIRVMGLDQQYIYYEIVHEAHTKENKVIDLTITQDCK